MVCKVTNDRNQCLLHCSMPSVYFTLQDTTVFHFLTPHSESVQFQGTKMIHSIALPPTCYQCGPILGAKVCHQLLLLVNSTPHWLAGRACRFHLQGVTAVVHGWQFMHWATIRVQVKRAPSTPQAGEFSAKENTPDFMLEHFIILYCNVTAGTPHRWGVTLMARTIQNNSTEDDID